MASNCVSKPQWAHLEYTWRLENFWELRALSSIEALEEDSGDVVWSRRFGDKTRGIWRLKVYPYGDSSDAGKGQASLFLSLDTKSMGANAKLYAIFGCYVLDIKGNKISGSGRSFTRQKFAGESARLFEHQTASQRAKCHEEIASFLADDLMKLLMDDTLTIKCDIDVFIGVKATAAGELSTNLSLKDELSAFLQKPDWLNVTVNCDSESFLCNRTLLAARSKMFCRALVGVSNTHSLVHCDIGASNAGILEVTRECDHWIIKLKHPGITAQAVGTMLDFLTADNCDLLSSPTSELAKVFELFIVSSVYEALKAACVDHLIGRISAKSDALAILAVSQECDCEVLSGECRHFLQYYTPELKGAELMRVLLPSHSEATTGPMSPHIQSPSSTTLT